MSGVDGGGIPLLLALSTVWSPAHLIITRHYFDAAQVAVLQAISCHAIRSLRMIGNTTGRSGGLR